MKTRLILLSAVLFNFLFWFDTGLILWRWHQAQYDPSALQPGHPILWYFIELFGAIPVLMLRVPLVIIFNSLVEKCIEEYLQTGAWLFGSVAAVSVWCLWPQLKALQLIVALYLN